MRKALLVGSVLVVAIVLAWQIRDPEPAAVTQRTGTPEVAPRVRNVAVGEGGAASSPAEEAWAARAPKDPTEFDVLPPEHGVAAVAAVMDAMPAWFDANFPEAHGRVLGADCAEPPCLLAVTYDHRGFSDPARMRAFLEGYQAEVERRTGWPMTNVSMEEGADGAQYVWMWAVPRDFPADDPVREDLLENATRRHAEHMKARLPAVVEAEPQGNEAG